jgi:hypothetical protein
MIIIIKISVRVRVKINEIGGQLEIEKVHE